MSESCSTVADTFLLIGAALDLSDIALPLFLPATRPDRLGKALNSGADAIILDLEDAVSADRKVAAREGLAGLIVEGTTVPVLLRINASDSAFFDEDVAACITLPLAAIILPKASDAAVCAAVARRTGRPVIGLVETALGLHQVHEVAHACARLAFGSIDFAADLGIAHAPEALAYARATLVMASRLADLPAPWDGVTVATDDAEAVLADCRHSVAMGFGGKLLIHPAQIAPARAGFAPNEAEYAWATRVVAAAESTSDALKLDGEMIDAPVVARAQQILRRASTSA